MREPARSGGQPDLGASLIGGLPVWGPACLGVSPSGGLPVWGPTCLGVSPSGGQHAILLPVLPLPCVLLSAHHITPFPPGLSPRRSAREPGGSGRMRSSSIAGSHTPRTMGRPSPSHTGSPITHTDSALRNGMCEGAISQVTEYVHV